MAENTMRLKIVAPNRIFYDGDVSMLEFTTTEGQMGIYPEHVPLTSVLVPCVVTITADGERKRAAIHDGFVEILKDRVTVMAEVIEWPEEIDRARAQEAKIRAERRLQSKDPNMNQNRAKMALMRSLIRLELTE